MYSKEKIFNLALGLLLLKRQIINADTETNNEASVLRTHWEVAFYSTLEDLDLDSLSMPVALELITLDPNDQWGYAYKYPSNCAFFRRIQSSVLMDNRDTQIPKRVGLYDHNGTTMKAIFCNEDQAVAEIIPNDFPLTLLPSTAGLCVAHRLAWLSAPLNVGKGAAKLAKEIMDKYIQLKAEAQEKDRNENFNFEDVETESEFVRERMS